MIGIIIALPSEAKSLLNSIGEIKEIKLLDKTAYECSICNHKAVIAISGIGKVNASLATQAVIDRYSPKFILNFGTCGGVNDSVQALNYYVIDKCCQYDFDLSELDDVPVGYIQDYDTVFFNGLTEGINLKKRSLASADKFTCHSKDVDTINSMGCSLCDMEGGAIGQVCTSNSIPLVIVKGITDIFNSGASNEQFYSNLQQVSEGFPSVIRDVINSVIKLLQTNKEL